MAGEIKKQRASWSGKWAFILAAAASAVGLGNMWRFPYLAAKYGGGTFLLTYVVLVFTFGVSLLLLETALGRKTGQSAIGAFKQFGKKYAFIGILASTVPFIITAVRLGLSAALTTLLAAESTGAQAGIGMRIRSLANSFDSPPMLMYIILLGIIGLILVKIVDIIERKLTGWQEKI